MNLKLITFDSLYNERLVVTVVPYKLPFSISNKHNYTTSLICWR